jgi:hypothetical protein
MKDRVQTGNVSKRVFIETPTVSALRGCEAPPSSILAKVSEQVLIKNQDDFQPGVGIDI